MTPEEAFTKVKPVVGHLRIFGCPVYIHIPKEKRTKLDPFGMKGTFVGYKNFELCVKNQFLMLYHVLLQMIFLSDIMY
jgi:hypothetical protein